MRRMFITLFFALVCCQTAVAGEWRSDVNGKKYLQDDGTYATGWYQDIDGTWYYLDNNTGYMLSDTTTPDGYYVGASGAWVKEVDNTSNVENYENVEELKISALSKPLNREVPFKIHFNNSYEAETRGTIDVSGVEISQAGAPYLKLSANDVVGVAGVNQIYRFTLSDGNVIDGERLLLEYAENLNDSFLLLSGPVIETIFERNDVISAEVWITKHEWEKQ